MIASFRYFRGPSMLVPRPRRRAPQTGHYQDRAEEDCPVRWHDDRRVRLYCAPVSLLKLHVEQRVKSVLHWLRFLRAVALGYDIDLRVTMTIGGFPFRWRRIAARTTSPTIRRGSGGRRRRPDEPADALAARLWLCASTSAPCSTRVWRKQTALYRHQERDKDGHHQRTAYPRMAGTSTLATRMRFSAGTAAIAAPIRKRSRTIVSPFRHEKTGGRADGKSGSYSVFASGPRLTCNRSAVDEAS
jgi:hypothetical protein